MDKVLENKLKDIAESLKSNLNFLAVFGSVARGENTEESDLDLFFDLEDWKLLDQFEDYLIENLNFHKIDLVSIEDVLREKHESVFKYFTEGSVLIYESERLFNNIKDERLLDRYERAFRI